DPRALRGARRSRQEPLFELLEGLWRQFGGSLGRLCGGGRRHGEHERSDESRAPATSSTLRAWWFRGISARFGSLRVTLPFDRRWLRVTLRFTSLRHRFPYRVARRRRLRAPTLAWRSGR